MKATQTIETTWTKEGICVSSKKIRQHLDSLKSNDLQPRVGGITVET